MLVTVNLTETRNTLAISKFTALTIHWGMEPGLEYKATPLGTAIPLITF